MKEMIYKMESRYYKDRLNAFEPYLYNAPIDTIFAMYRPKKEWQDKNFYKAIRTGAPYTARHMPWYKDLSDLSDEDKFYNQTDRGCGNWNSAAEIENMQKYRISQTVDHWWENIFSVKQARQRTVVRLLGLKFTLKRNTSDK